MHTITIDNGMTIINTHDAVGGIKNTSGCVGVERRGNRWIAKITIGKTPYHLGVFPDFDAAVSIRKVAENHRKNGTFDDWFSQL